MTALLFVTGVALLALMGAIITRVPFVARIEDAPARVSIALACGIVFTTTVMYLYSGVGLPWSRATLALPLVIVAATVAVRWRRPASGWRAGRGWLGIGACVAATSYGVLTARETCADLLYFWGPKAQAFYLADKLDIGFLTDRIHFLMHADYPPLLPLLYAWASIVAHRFSWWGALALTPLFLLATVLAFRGIATARLGEEKAGRFSMLLAAVLGCGFAAGSVAGAGEPPLIFFETIAVAILTFADDDDRGAWLVAALMLAAAAFLKVEGTCFAVVVLACFVVTRRRVLPAIAMAVPAVVLLGSWIVVVHHLRFVDTYRLGGEPIHPEVAGKTISITARYASYGAFYLPWIAALAPLVTGASRRRALLPFLTGTGVIAYTLFFYLHDADPQWWIASSAERVLLTALSCFVVASAAASE